MLENQVRVLREELEQAKEYTMTPKEVSDMMVENARLKQELEVERTCSEAHYKGEIESLNQEIATLKKQSDHLKAMEVKYHATINKLELEVEARARCIAVLKCELSDKQSFIDGQLTAIDARDRCISTKNYALNEIWIKTEPQHVDDMGCAECEHVALAALKTTWQDYLEKPEGEKK